MDQRIAFAFASSKPSARGFFFEDLIPPAITKFLKSAQTLDQHPLIAPFFQSYPTQLDWLKGATLTIQDEKKRGATPWTILESEPKTLINYLENLSSNPTLQNSYFIPNFFTRKDGILPIQLAKGTLRLGFYECKCFGVPNFTAFLKGVRTTNPETSFTSSKFDEPLNQFRLTRATVISLFRSQYHTDQGCLRIIITSPPSEFCSTVIGKQLLLVLDRQSAPSLFDKDLWDLIDSTTKQGGSIDTSLTPPLTPVRYYSTEDEFLDAMFEDDAYQEMDEDREEESMTDKKDSDWMKD